MWLSQLRIPSASRLQFGRLGEGARTSTCTVCHNLSLDSLQRHKPSDDSSKRNRHLAVPLPWPDLRVSAALCVGCSVLRDVIKRFYPWENFKGIHMTIHHTLTLSIDLVDNCGLSKQEELRLCRLPGNHVASTTYKSGGVY